MGKPSVRKIPILITSAIKVSAGNTAITDTQVRLELTLEAIELWRRTPGISKVVVCDGSDFDLTPHIAQPNATDRASCEVLHFQNDIARVKSQGKGYGEGEIIEHALQHSVTLKASPVFAKCTGKLWISNFMQCFKRFNGVSSFDVRGLTMPNRVETRFYMVSRDFYLSRMVHAHHLVNDDGGFFLEHAFLQKLTGVPCRSFVMWPVPAVVGISGSDGLPSRHGLGWLMLWNVRSWVLRLVGYFKPRPPVARKF